MSTLTIAMYKAVQWEKVKGTLRAFEALQGSYPNGTSEAFTKRWETLKDKTEAFIKEVEDNGLHY